jgi:eukaryotic-like serine/threonine-protein kinase
MSLSVSESVIAGRYQVIAKVASGGMGEVYRAHDAVLGREVAIKVLHPQFAGDRGFVERFRREARAAAILNHPNIVGVYDWGSTDGTYFMVMEFVRGHNLRGILAEYGRLEPAQSVEVAMPVLAALDHAHGHGIVHRDVKPENILISREGVVKVADFGLARAFAEASISLAEGTVTGTVQYLAPEQIQGQPADPRTDLYALGVVLFEVLVGHAPFSGETSLAIAYRHLQERVPAPSSETPGVPASLDRVVLHATEKDRANRPASARAMAQEVAEARKGLPAARHVAELALATPTTEFTAPERAATVTIPRADTPRQRRRRKIRRFLLWLAVIAAVVAGGWAAWTYLVPHYATVPDVTKMSQKGAFAALTDAGFVPATGTSVNSISVPQGDVVATTPPIGSRVKKGTTVSVSFSKGPKIVTVPKLVGLTQEQATTQLQQLQLVPVVKHGFSITIPKGSVMSQSVDKGTQIKAGNKVSIVISQGPKPETVPDVAGDTVAQATQVLESKGFKIGTQTEQFSSTVTRGHVIETKPAANAARHQGDTIELVVSKGPKTFPMPDVRGESAASATAQLKALGLQVHVVSLGPGTPSGIVVAQSPGKGATVQQGQLVTIYILS